MIVWSYEEGRVENHLVEEYNGKTKQFGIHVVHVAHMLMSILQNKG